VDRAGIERSRCRWGTANRREDKLRAWGKLTVGQTRADLYLRDILEYRDFTCLVGKRDSCSHCRTSHGLY
jgi:hypothetical protein